MKSLLIILVLLIAIVASAQTKSDRWILASCSNTSCIYYDKKTIERSGDIVTVWTRTFYRSNWPKPSCNSSSAIVVSEVSKEQYNCSSKKIRSLSATYYDISKDLICSQDFSGYVTINDRWSDAVPDTVGEQMLEAVCNPSSKVLQGPLVQAPIIVDIGEPPPLPKPSPSIQKKKRKVNTTINGNATVNN